MKITKVLINKDTKYYYKGQDMHTKDGLIKSKDIESKQKVKSNKGEEFYVLDADFIDRLQRLKRGPQIILPKDIGYILANTPITKDSQVLEAGTGSAFLSVHLARFVNKVYSYERDKRFYTLAKQNIEDMDIKNITLVNQDVYKKITQKNLDLAVLDLPEPQKALKNLKASLKRGGYLVCYLPTISQIEVLLKKIDRFVHIKTVELLERNWQTDKDKVRPKSQMIAHTAFLCFLRKV